MEFADFYDPLASSLARYLEIDLDRYGGDPMTRRSVVLRSLWFESQVRQQIAAARADSRKLVVINLASGFDTVFSRIANPIASPWSDDDLWIDADLPNVNRLKRDWFNSQLNNASHRIIDLDLSQPESIANHLGPIIQVASPSTTQLHLMFLAEGVLMYLSDRTVRALLAGLCDFGRQFQQMSLVLDWCSPLLTRFSRWHPGLRRAGIVEVPFSWCISQDLQIAQLEPRLVVHQSDDPIYQHCNVRMAALAWSYSAWHRIWYRRKRQIYGCSVLGLSR